jgi:uncharacterized protein with PQ loop repeat
MIEILTWMPVLVLPSAALIQLVKLWKTHDPSGVSVLSWLMFGVANIGAYFLFAETGDGYLDIRPILAFLLTSVLNFWVVWTVLKYRIKPDEINESEKDE